MTRIPSTVASVLVTLSVFGWTARADEASEARLQFELGEELYRQRRFEEAIERFIASNRLVPNANVVLNIARTYQYLSTRDGRKGKAESSAIEAHNWLETYLAFSLPEADRREGTALRDKLAATLARVEIRTEPAAAELFIDRENLGSVGKSPRVVAVAEGVHEAIARLAGRKRATSAFEAKRGTLARVDLRLEPIVGVVRVVSRPAGATVRLASGAAPLGQTPFEASLPVGPARLVIEAPGYVEASRDVDVSEERSAVLDVELTRAASQVATLTVDANTPGARALLAGRTLGTTPLSRGDLEPGRSELRIEADGHEPWAGAVVLEAGAATRVRANLFPEARRIWPGWKWVGYGAGGALLIAGGVTGYAANVAQDDFYAEPTRERYDRVGTLNTTADVLALTGLVVVGAAAVVHYLGARQGSHASVELDR